MGLWPFSKKKWVAPAPQLGFVISVTTEDIPSLVMLANPAGADGAVEGMAGPAGTPSEENMLSPISEGEYVAVSPGGGMFGMRVERVQGQPENLTLDPAMLEPSGLTEEMLAKFNNPAWRVMIEMGEAGNDPREAVVFITRLAQRFAALGDGIVMDTFAYRFFGPEGWRVEEPNPDFDVREHVNVHIESDSGWFHTHGLLKFGRPEMEIYGVPTELDQVAFATLLDISHYVIASAMIEPGQTCGQPSQPFYAREGTKNNEGHWNNLPVLELVDVDERGKPIASGAPKALQAIAAS